ncbi:translesion DNA synthesis-associated protein ImuA [Aquabacterium sp.]|uniref:translesion DNA synthesis-associated protein ImuA n=1 Tax=Aquabacterium sp. TaxID=1872578 RepID=UPI002BD0F550|nr:translesion DNA synthesis-associated protein ImuA [Aquabacterium sp.]HSW04433.1 translesion DNA synthesis-associated protein ImuA [Aquabacterium sp.]
MNLSLFDDLAAPVPEGPRPLRPLPVKPGPRLSGAAAQSWQLELAAPDALPPGLATPASPPPAQAILPPALPAPEDTHPAQRAPEDLHPALWRADQLGGGLHVVTASGFAPLDAVLPGGGWPHRVLTELLLPHPGLGELRLLAPALAAVSRSFSSPGAAGSHCVMLFDPPAGLYGSALAQLGLDARHWLVVRGRVPHGRPAAAAARQGPLRQLLPNADVLWALEQALKSGHVGAVLAWLPAPLKADAVRRLQLAAQAHDGPAFVFREIEARHRPSAAPLRLLLQSAGADALQLQVLKRRGPPLLQGLQLALPPVLGGSAQERAQMRQAALAQVQVRRAAFAQALDHRDDDPQAQALTAALAGGAGR